MTDAGNLAMSMRGAGGMMIDPCRGQQCLAKRAVDTVNPLIKGDAGNIDDLANKREAVRMHAG